RKTAPSPETRAARSRRSTPAAAGVAAHAAQVVAAHVAPGKSSNVTPRVAPDIAPELLECFREWRRATAKEQGVPAFIVLHDTSLEALCRMRPASLAELRQVPGFGERKTALYGPPILKLFAQFRSGARAAHA
ncbi:MAG: HRDC domain-containing protein, partial [Candidatus Acidiferrales bacterium]